MQHRIARIWQGIKGLSEMTHYKPCISISDERAILQEGYSKPTENQFFQGHIKPEYCVPQFFTIAFISFALLILSACNNNQSPGEPQPSTTTTKHAESIPAPLKIQANREAGKQVAENCTACHGVDGNTSKQNAPYIGGQHEAYLLVAMNAYLNGNRDHEEMRKVVGPLSTNDITDVAAHYSHQAINWKPVKIQKPVKKIIVNKKTIAKGKNKSNSCEGCHGPQGNSPMTGIPALAGLPPEYFKSALKAYFSGKRQEKKEVMKNFKHAVNSSDIKHLAAYFSAQTPKKTTVAVTGNTKAAIQLATQVCDGCHGINGNSGSPTIPSLSGNNAQYLAMAISYYKTGHRKNQMMKDAVSTLKKGDIHNLAAYYASKKPKKMTIRDTTHSTRFDPIGQGSKIAAACSGCHGVDGNSKLAGTPSLAGLNKDYLISSITAYQTGTRKHDIMKSFVGGLSEADMEKVSFYYALKQPTTPTTTVGGVAAKGAAIAEACTSCHGENGNSNQATTPSIAGQEPGYFVNAINHYKKGTRTHEGMANAVKELSANDTKNYAAYFAAQARTKPDTLMPEAPSVLAEKCDRCHGIGGFSSDPSIPRLAGQVEAYIITALQDYKNEKRTHTTMHAMAGILSQVEIKAIAKFYAAQK